MIRLKVTSRKAEIFNASKEQIKKALETCGLIAEGYAKENCAVDTGRLRGSITYKVVENEKYECYIGSNVEYAPYVEFGTGIYYPGGRPTPWMYEDINGDWHLTKGQKPMPFLKPAINEHIDEYKDIINQELKG